MSRGDVLYDPTPQGDGGVEAGPGGTSEGDIPSPRSVVNRGSSRDDGLRPLAALSFGSGLKIPRGAANKGAEAGFGASVGDTMTLGASPG